MSEPVVEWRGVTRAFRAAGRAGRGKKLHALRGVSLIVNEGQSVALVGESGCGKSTLARMAVRLEEPDTGEVLIDGRPLSALNRRERREQTTQIQLVPQDAAAALDPRSTIGTSVAEPLVIHHRGSSAERQTKVQSLLAEVGLDPSLSDRYPHQLSGGQRQRVVIARALALEPRMLIADEPVSALDVSVRAQVLNLLQDIQRQRSLALLVISHDLAVVRTITERIDVMYLGRIVESGDTREVIAHPTHPYTAALVAAFPDPNPANRLQRGAPDGEVPSPVDLPAGCSFAGRCSHVQDDCLAIDPLIGVPPGHESSACIHPLMPSRS
jgi:oligopeptide/dipeptide ABC transporter ATP-binding protein